jgi:hypothetical protein
MTTTSRVLGDLDEMSRGRRDATAARTQPPHHTPTLEDSIDFGFVACGERHTVPMTPSDPRRGSYV